MDPNERIIHNEETVAKKVEKCVACGHIASGKHHGAYSCDSCKIFFRRHALVSNLFPCQERNCVYTHNLEEFCVACRIRQCLTGGMELDAIEIRKNELTGRYELGPDTEDEEETDQSYDDEDDESSEEFEANLRRKLSRMKNHEEQVNYLVDFEVENMRKELEVHKKFIIEILKGQCSSEKRPGEETTNKNSKRRKKN